MTLTRAAVQVGDVSISVLQSQASRPPVVFLHGLTGNALEWSDSAAAMGDHHVVLIDLRGHGHSTRRPADLSRAAFVGDVIAALEHFQLRDVTLVGQSMGAHTAMLVAAERPDLIGRLVLLEGGEGSGNVADNRLMRAYFESWPLPFTSRAAAQEFFGDTPLAVVWTADLEQRADGFYPRFDPDVMEAAINAVSEPRWTEWSSVRIPTLVVYGQLGMFTPESKRRFLAANTSATSIEIAGASHDAHLDSTAAWIAVLREFLA